jgi:hypothetical protein
MHKLAADRAVRQRLGQSLAVNDQVMHAQRINELLELQLERPTASWMNLGDQGVVSPP